MFIVKQVISSQAVLPMSLGKLLDRRYARGAFAGKPARFKLPDDTPVTNVAPAAPAPVATPAPVAPAPAVQAAVPATEAPPATTLSSTPTGSSG
jgi:hypothetical protein